MAQAAPSRTEGMPGVRGKNVLVTGGSSGIGQAIAVRFAEHGANVAINYLRQAEEAAGTEEQVHTCTAACGRRASATCSSAATSRARRTWCGWCGRRSRGSGDRRARQQRRDPDLPPQRRALERGLRQGLAVNLRGAFMCAREAIRSFLAEDKPGVIVNVSSVDQLIPKPDYLGYSVSKGGMMNLTRTLALEYAGRGIRVNGIGPGATVTPINSAWIDDPVKRAQVESHIPMARAGTADEMAGVTCFLASDDAAYITGQTIFVDGGLTLFPSFREPWSSE
jgi:glucose 1-dehydrogenase